MVHVRSGPAEVIGSGGVTGFGGHPIALRLVDGGVDYLVELRFRSDTAVGDVAIDARHDAGALHLELVNFDGPDGRGSAVPVLLGAAGDHLYFFHFRVFRFGRTEDRTVHFTFFRAAKHEVDWEERDG